MLGRLLKFILILPLTFALTTVALSDQKPRAVDVSLNSKIEFIHISVMGGCPSCTQWEDVEYSYIIRTPEWKHFKYRNIVANNEWDAGDKSVWPKDLKWVPDEIKIEAGVPRFFVLVDGKVVWYSGWAKEGKHWSSTWNLLKKLVALKLKS